MRCVLRKACHQPRCGREAQFAGSGDKKARFCGDHKTEGMISVASAPKKHAGAGSDDGTSTSTKHKSEKSSSSNSNSNGISTPLVMPTHVLFQEAIRNQLAAAVAASTKQNKSSSGSTSSTSSSTNNNPNDNGERPISGATTSQPRQQQGQKGQRSHYTLSPPPTYPKPTTTTAEQFSRRHDDERSQKNEDRQRHRDNVNFDADNVTATEGPGGGDGSGGGREAGREISDIDRRLGELHDFLRRAKATGGALSTGANRGGGAGGADGGNGNAGTVPPPPPHGRPVPLPESRGTPASGSTLAQGHSQAYEGQQRQQKDKQPAEQDYFASRCDVDATSTGTGTPPRLERVQDSGQESVSQKAGDHPTAAGGSLQAMPAAGSSLADDASYAGSRGSDNANALLPPPPVPGGGGDWDDRDGD